MRTKLKTIVVCLLLGVGLLVKAQPAELIGHVWKVEKFVINNVETFFPNTVPAIQGTMELYPNNFTTKACRTIFGQVEYGAGFVRFLSVGGTLSGCPDSAVDYHNFDDAYIGNFFGVPSALPSGFHAQYTYDITTSGNRANLTLTNPNGDKAFYYREILSASEIAAQKPFSISPNPATHHLHIQRENASKMEVTFFDAQGKRIGEESITQKEAIIDISSWVSGVYWLKIKENGKEYTQKVLKK